MHYFLTDHVRYIERYNPDHTYTFIGPDVLTKDDIRVTVNAPDLYKYHQGAFIQDAFSYLTPSERDWMMSGIYNL